VYQTPIGRQSLSTDSGRCGNQVISMHFGNQSLQTANERFFSNRPIDFHRTIPVMSSSQLPKSSVAKCFTKIRPDEIGFVVTFAREGHDRIGAGVNRTINRFCEMDTKKRKS